VTSPHVAASTAPLRVSDRFWQDGQAGPWLWIGRQSAEEGATFSLSDIIHTNKGGSQTGMGREGMSAVCTHRFGLDGYRRMLVHVLGRAQAMRGGSTQFASWQQAGKSLRRIPERLHFPNG
jgi:hypothetical protein